MSYATCMRTINRLRDRFSAVCYATSPTTAKVIVAGSILVIAALMLAIDTYYQTDAAFITLMAVATVVTLLCTLADAHAKKEQRLFEAQAHELRMRRFEKVYNGYVDNSWRSR